MCAPASCVPAEGVSGAVYDGAPSGGITGAGVVEGDAVAVVVMVECSHYASKIARPNCAFSTSLELETEN